jgi:hypothetical protein
LRSEELIELAEDLDHFGRGAPFDRLGFIRANADHHGLEHAALGDDGGTDGERGIRIDEFHEEERERERAICGAGQSHSSRGC